MVSLYEITIPVFIRDLQTLLKLLNKGKNTPSVTEQQILDARLIADMGNFIFQIQIVTNTAKNLVKRLTSIEPPVFEDNEKTYDEVVERINKTIKVLEGVKESDFEGAETKEVVITNRAGEKKFAGKDYVLQNAIPNFYFHFVTAYGLLRKEGVDVGKLDYLGLVKLS